MAKEEHLDPTRELHGALLKGGVVHRMKKYRDIDGKVLKHGIKEAYIIGNPRDWKRKPAREKELAKRKPAREKELAHQNLWKAACDRASQIFKAGHQQPVTAFYTTEEAQTLYADYQARFAKQLPGKAGSAPDPEAPVDPATKMQKRFIQLPAFIRTIIYNNLKNA